jgi:hypothetical protein
MGEFARLDQRHHGGGAPVADHVEIHGKVAVPGAAGGIGIVFAGAEAQPDPAMASCLAAPSFPLRHQ